MPALLPQPVAIHLGPVQRQALLGEKLREDDISVLEDPDLDRWGIAVQHAANV